LIRTDDRTGFVVDDAIVVMENIVRHSRRECRGCSDAAGRARSGLHRALDESVAHRGVHSDFVDGRNRRRLFREFAVTLSVAILVSMLVSLTTTPMMCALLLGNPGEKKTRPLYRWSEDIFQDFIHTYERTLAWC